MFGIPNRKSHKEIVENLFYFSELQMLDCNMYVLKDEDEKLTVIDLGNGLSMKPFIASLEHLGLNPANISNILITHEHLDHIMGIYPLMEFLKENPPAILAHPYTAELLEEGDEHKIVPRMFGVNAKTFGINVVPIKNIRGLIYHLQFQWRLPPFYYRRWELCLIIQPVRKYFCFCSLSPVA